MSLLAADPDAVEAERRRHEVDGVSEVDPDDVGGAEEEEGGGGEGGAADDVGLHGPLPALVAQVAPDGGGDRVGAVLQPEDHAHVERAELEAPQDLCV